MLFWFKETNYNTQSFKMASSWYLKMNRLNIENILKSQTWQDKHIEKPCIIYTQWASQTESKSQDSKVLKNSIAQPHPFARKGSIIANKFLGQIFQLNMSFANSSHITTDKLVNLSVP